MQSSAHLSVFDRRMALARIHKQEKPAPRFSPVARADVSGLRYVDKGLRCKFMLKAVIARNRLFADRFEHDRIGL
jgi:hypothetical protein